MSATTRQLPARSAQAAPQDRPGAAFVFAVTVVATLCAVAVALVSWSHAGGLWRDEVNAVNITNVPSLREMWRNLDGESFPLLWLLLERGWTSVLGTSDAVIRAVGLVTALSLVAAVWLCARWCGYAPTLTLALIAVNPILMHVAGANRAYGLGMILDVIAYHAVWRLAQAPSRRRAVIAAVAALLATQTLYYDIIFVTAMLLGAAGVFWFRGERRHLPMLAGIELACVASLVPYVFGPVRQERAWSWVALHHTSVRQFLSILNDSLHLRHLNGGPVGVAAALLMRGVWAGLLLLCFAAWMAFLPSQGDGLAETGRLDVRRYACVTVALSVIGYGGFLVSLGYNISPWYLSPVSLIALVAACQLLQTIKADWVKTIAIPLLALLALLLNFHDTVLQVKERQANVDLAAGVLNAQTKPSDLVLVSPQWFGIPFARYYRGAAPFTTAPTLPQYLYGEPKYVAEAIMSPPRGMDHLQDLESVLQSGHSVWVVGDDLPHPQGGMPALLPPHARVDFFTFLGSIEQRNGYLLYHHSISHQEVRIPDRGPVSDVETARLLIFSGWRK